MIFFTLLINCAKKFIFAKFCNNSILVIIIFLRINIKTQPLKVPTATGSASFNIKYFNKKFVLLTHG